MHKILYGALLYILVTGGGILFALPLLETWLGFLGGMLALGGALALVYVAYAWLVIKTGATPRL